MPVTAKLSREFYDKLGDKIADELVNWFNGVDATYRSELKDLNELNFARFDAKVEQRFAESDARWERRMAEVDRRFAEVPEGFVRLEGRMDSSLHALKAELLKWMFGAWATLLAAMIALIKLG